jgi:transposase
MYHLGIDQHKKFSQVAVMDEKGKVLINTKMSNDKSSFESLKEQLNDDCNAVIEAGPNWGMMYDLLEDLGIETSVAHPLKTRAIAEARIKTDSIDAKVLAHLLRTDLVPKIHVPAKDIREQKNLLRHRFWLVRLTSMTKNRIHIILERNHVKIPDFSSIFTVAGRKFLNSLNLPEIDSRLLKDHLEILDSFKEHTKETEEWIDEFLKDNENMRIIDTLPGFGKIFSALIALEIDNIERFPSTGKFASYCCLVPSIHASGSKVYRGDLITTGNKWLKYAFIEAAWSSLRCSPYCRAYFDRIKKNKGVNVAVVALARRLTEIAFHCLKNRKNYEERPYMPYSR